MALTELPLPFRVTAPILAFGAHTKNRICFAHGASAWVSELHPDLSNLKDYLLFEKVVRSLLRKRPRVAAYDPHPDYASSRYALSLESSGIRMVPVQHHHAHIASCMADNGMSGSRVIGVAFDGTGFGSDGSLWGAEWLVGRGASFIRRAHLKEVALVGAAAAIRQPWRVLAAWFHGNNMRAPRPVNAGEDALVRTLCRKGFAWPRASSMGRLFDAVGVMVLKKKEASYEGELAIALEKISAREGGTVRAYPYRIIQEGGMEVVDCLPLLAAVSRDCTRGLERGAIGLRFHRTVAAIVCDVCLRLREAHRIRVVILSGGVFQNRLLRSMVHDSLGDHGFTVVTHRTLSCSDESLAIGQAAVAAAQTKRR